jgi:serine/threonine-protein kinase
VAAPLGSDPVARDVLEAGDVVAHVKRYHVRELLGEGGMGRVYRAYDPVLDRDVALKVMKSGVPEGERRRFHREALHGAKFCHPGFVRVYDLGLSEEGRVEWFAMEHLPGRDLEQIVRHCRRKGTTIPLRLLADVFRQVLGALQYSHDCRVVHRDVKPANMFVTRDPNTRFVTTKLLDFGIALDERDAHAVETLVCGDPRYMAPEQTRLGMRVDARADLYATGMSLYEAVTGHHPFEELLFGPAEDLLLAHRDVMPKPPSYHLRTDVPAAVACALDVVFAKACAKSPEDRFASARDMLRALWNVFE